MRLLTGVVEQQSGIPGEYRLHQNYPNPFNQATTIRYELPKSSDVELGVYNVVGQAVAVLAEGVQDAGYRSVRWDASALPSGVYFYRITAVSPETPEKPFTGVRKFILLK